MVEYSLTQKDLRKQNREEAVAARASPSAERAQSSWWKWPWWPRKNSRDSRGKSTRSTSKRTSSNKSSSKNETTWFSRTSSRSSTRETSIIARYEGSGEVEEEIHTEEEEGFIAALAERSCHLPGYTWWQDWRQYFANNHPAFCLCFQHPLHPIGKWMRVFGLIGSVVFGLAVTNVIWLLFIYNKEQDVVFTLSAGGFAVKNGTEFVFLDEDHVASRLTSAEVSGGMVILWTVGALAHGIFDNSIWYVSSCACCAAGSKYEYMRKYKKIGNIVLIAIVVIITFATTMVVIMRASLESGDGSLDIANIRSMGLVDDAIDVAQVRDASNLEFLMSYGVELILAWLVFFPIVETILFTGILGCGRVPILGGRPYELLLEERRKQMELEKMVEEDQIYLEDGNRDRTRDNPLTSSNTSSKHSGKSLSSSGRSPSTRSLGGSNHKARGSNTRTPSSRCLGARQHSSSHDARPQRGNPPPAMKNSKARAADPLGQSNSGRSISPAKRPPPFGDTGQNPRKPQDQNFDQDGIRVGPKPNGGGGRSNRSNNAPPPPSQQRHDEGIRVGPKTGKKPQAAAQAAAPRLNDGGIRVGPTSSGRSKNNKNHAPSPKKKGSDDDGIRVS